MNHNDFLMQEALGQLDPALLEEAEAQTGQKRRSVPVRVLTVAACLAAALAVGAVAIEMTTGLTGLQISGILSGHELYPNGLPGDMDGDVEDYSGYIIRGIENFNWDNISEELRAAAAEAAATAETQGYQPYYYRAVFDSRAELEEYLGFSLPENAVLTTKREGTGSFGMDTGKETERVVHTFACVDVVGKEDTGPIGLDIHASYAVPDPDHVQHEIWYDGSGEAHDEGEKPSLASYTVCENDVDISISIYAASGSSFYYHYKDVALTQETYVTPGGIEMVIVQMSQGLDSRYQKYTAYFALDGGMMMELSAHGRDCKDVKGIFYAILDAYDISLG